MVEGVDYAFPPRPSIAGLAAAGKKFACRYGGPGSLSKQLSPTEAAELSAAGIAIVANAEGSTDGMLGGYSTGVSWAVSAERHFAACGMPPGRPIYLSADFDVTSAQWPAVRDALRGAASVLGAARVGVYGGRRAIEWARRDGVAAWYWQAFAWSGGVWVPGNHIEQYRNGVTLAGASLDLDRAPKSDYGQWTIGDDMSWTEKPANSNFSYGEITLGTNIAAWKVVGLLEAIAPKVGIDAEELAQITAAAKTGAEAGVVAAADELADAIVAELPETGLTKADVETAVRKVLGSLDS
jgi:hypothetical protein